MLLRSPALSNLSRAAGSSWSPWFILPEKGVPQVSLKSRWTISSSPLAFHVLPQDYEDHRHTSVGPGDNMADIKLSDTKVPKKDVHGCKSVDVVLETGEHMACFRVLALLRAKSILASSNASHREGLFSKQGS
jgi:hypothetical protein